MNAPKSVVELARQLIAIPSVNPAGDPGTDHTGEAEIAEFIGEFLKSMGADVTEREILPGRPNVIGRFPSNGKGKPRLAFAPHTDTVGVAGMTVQPFGGEIKNGQLYGRGACDTKGPMAAQLWALWKMRDQLAELSHEIYFLGLMDEEAGQAGSIAAAAELSLDFALVAEPTEMDVVHTHKGSLWLEISTRGKSAHSSRPELGSNAIYSMSRVVSCLEEKLIPELARRFHPVLGSPTLSVGTIRGGRKTNVVPDYCQIEVDVRTIPGMERFIEELTLELTSLVPEVNIVVEKTSPPLFTKEDHPLIASLQKLGSKTVGAPWFCDAAMFAAAGTASVAIGPGSIQQAHTVDEYIEISALEEGAERFEKFLNSLRQN